jgi:3-phenylpropionate/trans-cinnamate dioxygenase ferredoxin subunit
MNQDSLVADFQYVLSLKELPLGSQKPIEVGSNRLLLCHEADTGAIWAVQDLCPHAQLPLEGGLVRSGTIQCPRHGACFDLATGMPLNKITPKQLVTYLVKIEGDRVLVSGLESGPREFEMGEYV